MEVVKSLNFTGIIVDKNKKIKKRFLLGNITLVFVISLSSCICIDRWTWKPRADGVGWSSDNKPIFLKRNPKGIKIYDCSGHNIPTVCIKRRYDNTEIYFPDIQYGILKKTTKYDVFFVINEKKIIARSDGIGNNVSFYELTVGEKVPKLLANFSYEDVNKQDFRISRNGKYLAWAESSGLLVMNIKTGETKKYFDGIPVRYPVFADDEERIAFYLWIDTTTSTSWDFGTMPGTLQEFSITHNKYDESKKTYVKIGETREYAGVALFNMKTERILKVYPNVNGVCPHMYSVESREDCKSHFSPWEYESFTDRLLDGMNKDRKHFIIDAFRDELIFDLCNAGYMYSPDKKFFGFLGDWNTVSWYDSATKKIAGSFIISNEKW